MTVKELVEHCEIRLAGTDKLEIRNVARGKKMLDELKTRKQEIIDYLVAEEAAAKAAAEDRKAKIAAIEGLAELQAARDAEAEYHHEFNRRLEDEALSSIMPARPKVSAEDVAAKHPRAAAYIKAENWTYSNNYTKNAAGRKALERIINGEDHEQVLAEMEAEWSAHCDQHVWD
jgi:hypothetical protein